MGKHYEQISLEERCEIARLHKLGHSLGQIAASVARATSSIAREVKRNAKANGHYEAIWAHDLAWARCWRGSKLGRNEALRSHVLERLGAGWSPEQIAGRLKKDKASASVSHETIYRFIYAQMARTNDGRWRHYLPRAKSRRGRTRRANAARSRIAGRVGIEQRPAYIERRRQAGHWEADLLMLSNKKSNLLVAQERSSRFVRLARQHSKGAAPTIERLKGWFGALGAPLRRTLTQDNGPEFSLHQQLHRLGMKTYFCDAHSPWQKAGVENTNARLRRFIPLNTPIDSFTDRDLQALEECMNNTPRKCLGFKTPAEVFFAHFKPLHLKCECTSRPSPG